MNARKIFMSAFVLAIFSVSTPSFAMEAGKKEEIKNIAPEVVREKEEKCQKRENFKKEHPILFYGGNVVAFAHYLLKLSFRSKKK